MERDAVIGRGTVDEKGHCGEVAHAVIGNDEGNMPPSLFRRRDLSMERAFKILEFYKNK